MIGGSNIAMNLPRWGERPDQDLIRGRPGIRCRFSPPAPRGIPETLANLSIPERRRVLSELPGAEAGHGDLHRHANVDGADNPSCRILREPGCPTQVTFGTLSSAAFRLPYENDLGEFETRLFLFEHLKDQNEAVRGASGWDGDRYAVVNTPQGPGIAWLTVWDSPVEAGEFFDLAGQAIEKRFDTKAGATTNKSVKSYSAGDRSLQVTATEVQGLPVAPLACSLTPDGSKHPRSSVALVRQREIGAVNRVVVC